MSIIGSSTSDPYIDIIKEGLAMLPMDKIQQPIIWWTDPHLQPGMETENARVLSFILEAAKLIKPALIVNTGDIFHTKDEVYTSVLQQYEEYLEEYTAIAPVIQIVGNHDWGKLYSAHSLQRYKNMKNVTNVSGYHRLDHMAFMGYCRDRVRFNSLIKECAGARDIFCHTDMNSFQIGSSYVEERHDYADPEMFGFFENVFSGHYHLAQQKTFMNKLIDKIKEKLVALGLTGIKIPQRTNMIFCGSPQTLSWGEADQHKRVGIIDGVTGEFYDLPTGMTFHKKLIMAPGEVYPTLPLDEIARGVEHRVVFQGTKAQAKDMEAAAPVELVGKIAFDIKQDKFDRLIVSIDANLPESIKRCFYQKLSSDYNLEVNDENVAVVSASININIKEMIEKSVKYAEAAKNQVA